MPIPNERPAYGSDIPGARRELRRQAGRIRDIAEMLVAQPLWAVAHAHELEQVAANIDHLIDAKLRRKGYDRVAPEKASRVDTVVVAEVKRLARTTDLNQAEIGAQLNIASGRVSEILNGLRDDNGNIIK